MRRRRGQEMVSDAARWRSEAERSRASVIWPPSQHIGLRRMRCFCWQNEVPGLWGFYPRDWRMKTLASV
jgi:hypothetical protein